ncbi:site-specific integrase [Janthinobacterium lividum]|uniref:Site-specific integrase n=1 Tax=Janthinobacterium lividum TaxID=29581 RepID=A0A5C4NTU9_9BURK|nr:site-specific integrase [Janthinobacterium lividum]TNC78314.1 site-specific integrase [Janthinobacterium lividum]
MSIWDDKEGRKHVGIMVDGKRIHRKLPKGATARDAKLVEAELLRAAERTPSQKQVVIPGDPPMTAILAIYLEHSKSLKSADTSKFHVVRLGPWAALYKASQAQEFADHFIRDASKKVENAKTKELESIYAPATINRSLACAKKGLALAWRQRLIPENFGLRIENVVVNNEREVFLSVKQVQRIAEFCSARVQAAIWIALLTGARRGEIFKIRRQDIGRDTITLPSSHTKTLKTRIIPIIPALRPWLPYLPLTNTPSGVKSSWQRARVRAGMHHVNFHDLRHSCASIMLGLGVDLYTISKILGHTNIRTTQRYAHLQVDAQRTALDKLSNLVQVG